MLQALRMSLACAPSFAPALILLPVPAVHFEIQRPFFRGHLKKPVAILKADLLLCLQGQGFRRLLSLSQACGQDQ
jgi:hypothetical protein